MVRKVSLVIYKMAVLCVNFYVICAVALELHFGTLCLIMHTRPLARFF